MSHQIKANQGHTARPQNPSGGNSIRSPRYSLLPFIPHVVSTLPGSRGTRLSKAALSFKSNKHLQLKEQNPGTYLLCIGYFIAIIVRHRVPRKAFYVAKSGSSTEGFLCCKECES